jgi:hypothetical protein
LVPRSPEPPAMIRAASSAPISANRALTRSITNAKASIGPCGVSTILKTGI